MTNCRLVPLISEADFDLVICHSGSFNRSLLQPYFNGVLAMIVLQEDSIPGQLFAINECSTRARCTVRGSGDSDVIRGLLVPVMKFTGPPIFWKARPQIKLVSFRVQTEQGF